MIEPGPLETDISVTGVWQGLFSYPRRLPPVSFGAVLIQTGSHVGGSTTETGSKGRELRALLDGRRQGREIGFIKTYEPDAQVRHQVIYKGTLNTDATEIEGRWSIPGNWSGKFLLIRSGGREAAVTRETFERA